jgi:peptide/nickel transport system substrate-binding protein
MAADKVKMGGVLKLAHGKEAGVIGNPVKLMGWNHEFIDNTLQAFLYASNENLGELNPFLATSYELAPDRSYYIFKLRKGVKFHDGTDFNAQAAKWNHDMWVQAGRGLGAAVSSIEVIDDYTLKYNLKAWDAVTLTNFRRDSYMISPTAWEKNGAEWADFNPVGTGPFKLVDQKRGSFLQFEKFKEYWGAGAPYLDGMRILTIVDPMTAMAALKSQEVDAWLGVDTVSASQALKEGKLTVQQFDAVNNVIQFNSIDPESPWSNIKLRMALEYAINKEAIVESVNRGMGRAVYTVLHSIDRFPPGPGTTPRKYDPAKAKQLMTEAGYPNGLKVKILYASNPNAKDAVVALQGMLSEVGIEIIPTPLAGSAFNEALFKPTPHSDLILGNLRGGGGNVIGSTSENFGKNSVFFQSVKKPDGFQDLIAEAMTKTDNKEILKLLYEAEKKAYDMAMCVPVDQAKFTALMQPYVKDAFFFWGGSPYPNVEKTWLDK